MLIPGFTGSKEDFLPILEPLAAAGRTVYAVDQRGQYQSPHAAGPVWLCRCRAGGGRAGDRRRGLRRMPTACTWSAIRWAA